MFLATRTNIRFPDRSLVRRKAYKSAQGRSCFVPCERWEGGQFGIAEWPRGWIFRAGGRRLPASGLSVFGARAASLVWAATEPFNRPPSSGRKCPGGENLKEGGASLSERRGGGTYFRNGAAACDHRERRQSET